MSSATASDALLIRRIREGEDSAWQELIARFEGRLLAFVESRTRHRAEAEDIVQEAFVGFLTSLPNFDESRPLEGYLFSIAAHKLTDALRREGRRPAIPLAAGSGRTSSWEPPGTARAASSIVRSHERRGLEEEALAQAIVQQIEHWRKRGDWQKLRTAELLFVCGWANKEAAEALGLSEQAVANYKFEFLSRLRTSLKKQQLCEDVFPELHETK